MGDSLLLEVISPTTGESAAIGLPPGELTLRRAWPREPGRLSLEYVTGEGRIVAGQWFADATLLARVASSTAKAGLRPSVAVVDVGGARVLLQAWGADRRLPGLAPLVARAGAALVSHRPERRAVVRLDTCDGARYVKVVRSERAGAVIAAGRIASELAEAAFATPELLEVDDDAGAVTWCALAGVSLFELAGSDRLAPAARLAGAALRSLHEVAPAGELALHDAEAEICVLQRWLSLLEPFDPAAAAAVRERADGVMRDMRLGEHSPPVLLHRDFYDKQVFVDEGGQVGMLDFDMLSMGEAALDLANVLVHFELRALQGRCSQSRAKAAATALVAGYGPPRLVRQRLRAYADATLLRLACLYSFRPGRGSVVPALLGHVGQPVPGVTTA